MNSTIDYIELVRRENIINEDQVPADNAFASSTHIEGGYLEREAFDLNTNSQWRSQFPCADTEYIGIDLGSEKANAYIGISLFR